MIKLCISIMACSALMLGYTLGSDINNNYALFYKDVDKELQMYTDSYYNMYNNLCPSRVKELSNRYTIQFTDFNDNRIGLCTYKINGYKIQIDRKWWNRNDEVNRFQLMFHELAHCVIGRGHVELGADHYMNPEMIYLPFDYYIKQVEEDINTYCAK